MHVTNKSIFRLTWLLFLFLLCLHFKFTIAMRLQLYCCMTIRSCIVRFAFLQYFKVVVIQFEWFTYEELANMQPHLWYHGCSGRAAQRHYGEIFLQRWQSHHTTFAAVHWHLKETGSFRVSTQDNGCQMYVRTPNLENEVLNAIFNNSATISRCTAQMWT